MIKPLYNKNLLGKIALFSDYRDIISLKESDDEIGSQLNIDNHEYMKKILFYHFSTIFNRVENDRELDEQLKRKIFKTYYYSSQKNWEKKMEEINKLKELNEFIEPELRERIEFIFKIHRYLLDIRKSKPLLEYNNSTSFMYILYDLKQKENFMRLYYNKYINEEYIKDINNNKIIKMLREKFSYEKEVLNIKNSLREISNNNKYMEILNKQILKYDYKKIINEFKDIKREEIIKLNPIIFIIWYITAYFNFYCDYIDESLFIYKSEKNPELFLIEFIAQHNDIINVILYLNSILENVNIIINNWNKFINKNDKASFSLLELFLSMYKERIYNKYISLTIEKFRSFINKRIENGENFFSIKKERNKMDIVNESQDETTDDSFSIESINEENISLYQIIEDIGNCILDIELNKCNANLINHTDIILGKNYEIFEEIIIRKLTKNVENCLKEGQCIKIFDELKELLEVEKSRSWLKNEKLKIINRTRKKLFEKVIKKFVPFLNDKLNANNKYYTNYYNEDFYFFSEESEKIIMNNIENDINNVKNILYNKYSKDEVDKYIDYCGDEFALLFKKLLFFYHKEKQFYEENDRNILNYLQRKSIRK